MEAQQAKYEVMAPIMDLADVKKYIAPTASDKELFMFMNISKAYGLNPFKREVHFIKYGNNPGQVVVGYETFLKRAEATGMLNGWSVSIQGRGTPEERAQITIHRKDWSNPFTWEVLRKEFDKGQSTWKLMPEFMLKKVAISQGMRICFSEQLGGMPYSPEEINGKGSDELPKGDITEAAPVQPELTPVKEKTLFETLMTARGNFCNLIMSNKDKILDFLPDEMKAIKDRWNKASAAGAGGVAKGAPWPLERVQAETSPAPSVVDFGENDDPGPQEEESDPFVAKAEAMLAELTDSNKSLILKLYSMRPGTAQEVREQLGKLLIGYRDAFLSKASKAIDSQNATK